MKQLARLGVIALLAASCAREPVKVVNPNYVVLRPLSAEASEGATSASIYGSTVYFKRSDRIIDLTHLKVASAQVSRAPAISGEERYHVLMLTTPAGARLLHGWTAAHIGQQVGFFVNGRLVMAPHVETVIDDAISIDGDFTKEQAEAFVAAIQAGGPR